VAEYGASGGNADFGFVGICIHRRIIVIFGNLPFEKLYLACT